MSKANVLVVGSLVAVQFGNKGDCGKRAGVVLESIILAIKPSDFGTTYMVSPVNEPELLGLASNCTRLFESGEIDAAMYCTNAREVGSFFRGSMWTREEAIESLGFDAEALAEAA